jgi:4-hydroxy-tetrahydrodipicolinate synthase
MSIFEGICTALITPLDNNQVSTKRLRHNIDYQLDNGINALLILGTTGEPSTLDYQEQLSCIDTTVLHTNKAVPVIVGISSNSTDRCIQAANIAQAHGANALLICTPYYNKCTQQGLIAHYTAIANSTNLPIIAYNVPSRTGVNMHVDTVVKLSKIHNIVAIKEASGDLDKIADIIRRTNHTFDIYGGDDILALPTMSLGARGIISVISNAIPSQMSMLANACLEQNYNQARDIQLGLVHLLHAMYVDVNPIGIKTLLHTMGLDSGQLRLPLTPMSKLNTRRLTQEWLKYSQLIGRK